MEKNRKEKIGSIYYDKNRKNWRCTYYIYEKDTQEETRKTKSFLTEQEAKDFLASIQYQKGNELFIKNNGIPLNQLMRENVQRKLDMNLIGERSYTRIMESIKIIEKSPMSKKNINDITSSEIQNYLNSLKDYSNSTIKKVKEQFSQAFREAVNKGYIIRNPMLEVIRPKSTQIRKPVRALEIEEQQKLTNYLINTPITDVPFKVAYLIQMYLGLRIGEALALRSTDINLHRNLITIDKTLTKDKEGKIIMKYLPKTYAGIREVPIPIFIRNDIINQMRLAEGNKDKQLFLDKNENYVRPENANRRLRELMEKMNIPSISSHSLRHTYGTRCVEAGMRAVALQRLMGHSDVAITLNTYTSVFNKYKEAELEKVNNYYMNNEIVSADNLLTENNNLIESIVNEKVSKESEEEYIQEKCEKCGSTEKLWKEKMTGEELCEKCFIGEVKEER